MTSQLTRRVKFRGTEERHDRAAQLLKSPGDLSLVVRGHKRSAVMACPDGCGEVVTINLDRAAGPAWRVYDAAEGLTLYPSVWRDSGCGSHFIVWNGAILWMDSDDDTNSFVAATLEDRTLAALQLDRFRPYVEIADELGEIPWAVLWSCQRLAKRGLAEPDEGDRRDWFRRTTRREGD